MPYDTSDLADFDSRYTMRYVRTLGAPVERVWRAVTDPEQLNVWLLPVTEIDLRPGGRCRFSWGAPGDTAREGSVLVYEPPHRVRYGTEDDAIEFVLEPAPEGTRLTFLQLFSDRFSQPDSDYDPDDPGAVLPAPGTPWRPGFVAGFHVALDDLARFVADPWPPARIHAESERRIAIANDPNRRLEDEDEHEPGLWRELVEVYTKRIRDRIPAE